MVPKKLMKAKDIRSNTKLVLCYLLSYTGAGSQCYPSINKITDDLGISKRTVITCIKESIKKGYITKIQENNGRGIGKKNIYTLLFMSDYKSVSSAEIAQVNNTSAKIAGAKNSLSSAKNDKEQVQNSTSNNNSINNNINNNKKDYFTHLLPAEIDTDKWKEWINYRIEKKKKLTESTVKAQIKFLVKNIKDYIQIIDNSIMNGWTGLFEIKNNNSMKNKKGFDKYGQHKEIYKT